MHKNQIWTDSLNKAFVSWSWLFTEFTTILLNIQSLLSKQQLLK